jgi:hypothetical protein
VQGSGFRVQGAGFRVQGSGTISSMAAGDGRPYALEPVLHFGFISCCGGRGYGKPLQSSFTGLCPQTVERCRFRVDGLGFKLVSPPGTSRALSATRGQRARPEQPVDIRLPGNGKTNSHGARLVHQILTMVIWTRTIRLSRTNSLFIDNFLFRSALSPSVLIFFFQVALYLPSW